jgi:hypothetical protein
MQTYEGISESIIDFFKKNKKWIIRNQD